jgi:VanZ family protein
LNNDMNKHFSWFVALSWTLLVFIALLYPGNNLIQHKYLLSTFLATFFNLSLKHYDFIEAMGHVILFGVLTVFWVRVLGQYFQKTKVILLTIGIIAAVGIITEIGQYFVNRDSEFLDLMANFIGALLIMVWISGKTIISRHSQI